MLLLMQQVSESKLAPVFLTQGHPPAATWSGTVSTRSPASCLAISICHRRYSDHFRVPTNMVTPQGGLKHCWSLAMWAQQVVALWTPAESHMQVDTLMQCVRRRHEAVQSRKMTSAMQLGPGFQQVITCDQQSSSRNSRNSHNGPFCPFTQNSATHQSRLLLTSDHQPS